MHDEGSPAPKSRNRLDAPDFEGIIIPQTNEDGQPSVGFDWRRYEDLLSDAAISDEDKRKVIEALWSIITSFVQLGFGVHPIQQAKAAKGEKIDLCLPDCGQLDLKAGSESITLLDYAPEEREEDA
jgi:hypothetical protein